MDGKLLSLGSVAQSERFAINSLIFGPIPSCAPKATSSAPTCHQPDTRLNRADENASHALFRLARLLQRQCQKRRGAKIESYGPPLDGMSHT